MALTIEDGSGVASANSFVTAAEADAFLVVRGYSAWTGTEAVKEAALAKAFDYLCNGKRFDFRGVRTTAVQRAPFPRTGCQERNGPSWGNNDIPWRLKDAQCLLGLVAIGGKALETALARGGAVTSESIGPISTSYAANAPNETVYTGVLGLLWPLLNEGDWREATPYLAEPVDWPEYTRGTYSDPSTVTP